MAKVVAVCISENKGERKKDIGTGMLLESHGLEGDAHTGTWHRQISLLAMESIQKMRDLGLDVHQGDFAENLTTEGIELVSLPIGTKLSIGESLLEITQIGKVCHARCAIYYQAGDCVMPKEGVFARVLKSGRVSAGDVITVIPIYNATVITLSDRGARGETEDLSGPVIRELLQANHIAVDDVKILSDDKDSLIETLKELADEQRVDLVITTGGTGLSPRDNTPEATLAVIEKEVPGIAETIRAESLKKTNRAMLTRGIAGVRGKTLIINLPGSKKAVRECMEVILPVLSHALEVLTGKVTDCGR